MKEHWEKVDTGSVTFDGAPRFQKLAELSIEAVVIADGGEEIVTQQKSSDGSTFIETTKTARPGDAIVSRDENDVYIIDKDKFTKLYKIHPDGERYVSTNTGRAVFLTEDTVIDAPWGEQQHIKAGGVLFKSDIGGDVYGNQAHSFNEDFGRVMADGTVVPLSMDLSAQKKIAEQTHSEDHVQDLTKRIHYRDNQRPTGFGSDVSWGGLDGQDALKRLETLESNKPSATFKP
ncbi:MAG: hypothetical protein KDK08_02750 [Rhizobiaceae bacterium]|nr:hypothetical protein [Rhizobiaceae bacterium]